MKNWSRASTRHSSHKQDDSFELCYVFFPGRCKGTVQIDAFHYSYIYIYHFSRESACGTCWWPVGLPRWNGSVRRPWICTSKSISSTKPGAPRGVRMGWTSCHQFLWQDATASTQTTSKSVCLIVSAVFEVLWLWFNYYDLFKTDSSMLVSHVMLCDPSLHVCQVLL